MNNPNNLFSFSRPPSDPSSGSSSNSSSKNGQHENKDMDIQLKNPWLIVRDWYASELGQVLVSVEKQILNQQLEQLFGYNFIQLGALEHIDSLNNESARFIFNSKISRQFVFESLLHSHQVNVTSHINTRFDELPVQNNSIDVVLLPHTLEFESNPHQILREVERVLVAEGRAIFLGFNPMSLWGLWHKYYYLKRRSITKSKVDNKCSVKVPLPSCGHLITQGRLKDWLQLLGFDVELVKDYFYRPPIQNASLLKHLEFIEKAGELSRIIPAGAYMMTATKRVSTLTPIRQKWTLSETIVGSKVSQQPNAGFKNKNLLKKSYKK